MAAGLNKNKYQMTHFAILNETRKGFGAGVIFSVERKKKNEIYKLASPACFSNKK